MPGPRESVHLGQAIPPRLGEFAIEGVLGEGGSGVVYAATWGPRQVALKVLRREWLATERERQRFLQEARTLSDIGHPGVIKVLACGELDDGRPYLAMERLEGETLAARLAVGPLPLDRALRLFDQIARASHALHQGGLVHRDLKPENIFLVREEFAVLLDFGIAKELDAPASTVTQQGGVRGTPAYMAPERFFGQPASVATDVYELGVVLFAMLTGRLPWDDTSSPTERLDPRRPAALGVSLPAELENRLVRALSTRPENRPASAGALADAIQEAGRGLGGDVRVTADLRGGAAAAAVTPRLARDESAQALAPTLEPERATPEVTPAAAVMPARAQGSRARRGLVVALALALVVAAAALGATAWWRHRGRTVVALMSPALAEAEAANAGAPPPAPPRAPHVFRVGDDAQLFGIVQHFAADDRVVVGLRFHELRRSKLLADMIDQAKDSRGLTTFTLLTRMCDLDVVEDLDWVAFGLDDKGEVDIAAGGVWKRAQVEDCLGKLGVGNIGPDNFEELGPLTKMTRKNGTQAWMGWLDDHSFLISSRPAADQAWMEERVRGRGSLLDRRGILPLVIKADPHQALWVLGEPAALVKGFDLTWPADLPRPRLVAGGVALTEQLDLRFVFEYADASTAVLGKEAVAKVVAELERNPLAKAMFGELEVIQYGHSVEVTAHLSANLVAMLLKDASASME